MCRLIAVIGVICAAASTAASAHTGTGSVAGIEPWILILILMLACVVAYGVGLHNRWRAASGSRSLYTDAIAFATGIASMALVLGGPVERWTENSFSAHMFQHEVLMLVAAPLLVLGRPLATWAWAVPAGRRHGLRLFDGHPRWKSIWRALTGVTGATLLQLVAI